ncbi:MAG: hypothetical protein GF347_04740 [Candidatus Moranbacteria bacterium]|nr:hypothetical protein [Candidatus Moranbacteria bacterium]
MNEKEKNEFEDEGQEDWLSDTKEWLQDNIRIVLAILIVLVIAVGVYFYSKRGASDIELASDTEETEELAQDEEQMEETETEGVTEEEMEGEGEEAEDAEQEDEETAGDEEMAGAETEEGEEDAQEVAVSDQEETGVETEVEVEETQDEEPVQEQTDEEMERQREEEQQKLEEEQRKAEEERKRIEQERKAEEEQADQAQADQETVVSQSGETYEVTAAPGDCLTTLARTAVRQHLDSSNGADLSSEHKIYIEDYLAKKHGYRWYVAVGERESFNKGEIQEAIDASQRLDESQLNHLKVYSSRVSGL